MKILLVLSIITILSGCSSQSTEGADGAMCEGTNGKMFILKHNLGDAYTPIPFDINVNQRMLEWATRSKNG